MNLILAGLCAWLLFKLHRQGTLLSQERLRNRCLKGIVQDHTDKIRSWWHEGFITYARPDVDPLEFAGRGKYDDNRWMVEESVLEGFPCFYVMWTGRNNLNEQLIVCSIWAKKDDPDAPPYDWSFASAMAYCDRLNSLGITPLSFNKTWVPLRVAITLPHQQSVDLRNLRQGFAVSMQRIRDRFFERRDLVFPRKN